MPAQPLPNLLIATQLADYRFLLVRYLIQKEINTFSLKINEDTDDLLELSAMELLINPLIVKLLLKQSLLYWCMDKDISPQDDLPAQYAIMKKVLPLIFADKYTILNKNYEIIFNDLYQINPRAIMPYLIYVIEKELIPYRRAVQNAPFFKLTNIKSI